MIRDVLLLGHRQAFAWVDEWIGKFTSDGIAHETRVRFVCRHWLIPYCCCPLQTNGYIVNIIVNSTHTSASAIKQSIPHRTCYKTDTANDSASFKGLARLFLCCQSSLSKLKSTSLLFKYELLLNWTRSKNQNWHGGACINIHVKIRLYLRSVVFHICHKLRLHWLLHI